MPTSHKHTHTRSKQFWLWLLVLTLLVGGLGWAAVKTSRWSAKAESLETVRTRLQAAKAQYLANPTQENTAKFDQALASYKVALTANPAPSAAPVQGNDFGSPFVSGAVNAIVTEAVSTIVQNAPVTPGKPHKPNKNEQNELPIRTYTGTTGAPDQSIQSTIPPGQNAVTNPLQNFDGPDMDAGAALFGGRFAPNDPNADVGPNHVVVTTNGGMQIFNKTGAALTPVFRMSQLLTGLQFANNDDGDPIVLYDPLADRWLISQFQVSNVVNGSTRQHVAISRTGDPTGQYFAYDFPHVPGRFGDYPHFGVWPDGYYMTTNDFNFALTAFLGASFYAYDREKMLAGLPAQVIAFSTGPTDGGLLPTDIDGVNLPPAGTPNLFIEFFADEFGDTDSLRVFEFRANFANPAASTLTQYDHDAGTAGAQNIPVAAFDARQPPSRAVIDQPAPAAATDSLDAIADRLMFRLAYRRLQNGDQSYVLNFTVNVSGVNPTNAATYQGGVRWTELRRTSSNPGGITINQQATYAPGAISGATGRNLWMAGIAQDGEGNIGLAANASSTTLIPTVIYTGRLAGDPANTLPQGEVDALAAVTRGVQIGTSNRWGDYSSLSVDPADECTFWGAFEYVDGPSSSFDWNTRVFSFKVNPACVSPAKGSLAGTATNMTGGGAPIENVLVTLSGGLVRLTNASGAYSFTSAAPANTLGVAPGTYTASCSKPGFNTVTGNVVITAGNTATFNCAMQGIPIINQGPGTIATESCATDGRLDPNELVTVSLAVTNTGGGPTVNLVGTVANTGGVTNVSGPQSYGVVVPGQTVARTFTFRVNPALACGGNVVISLALQDGAMNFGTFTYIFGSGTPVFAINESFNGVTPPALPAGWAAVNASGGAPLWQTQAGVGVGASNAVVVDDPAGVTDKLLTTPSVTITVPNATLSFQHTFLLEAGYDGGVVEVSINNGPFVDVTSVTAGGTFTQNGYTDTIDTGFSSPIAGRMAFTGVNAGGFGNYITSTVQFGAALNGQPVRFRFRMASDTTVAGTGWRVDNVQVTAGAICCLTITPTVSLADPLICLGPGGGVTGNVSATNSSNAAITGRITVALPAGLVGIPNSCTANATVTTTSCTVDSTSVVWEGTIPAGATLAFSYRAEAGQVTSGTQLCVTTTGNFPGNFPGVGFNTVQACTTVNCQPLGPGVLPNTGSPVSDQRAGSVLIYNFYTSTVGSSTQNTSISLTNIEPNRAAFVHLFFVDGTTCSVADAYICLTPNQTATFLASDLDPGTTGYLVAVATDRNGCPINFNYLIGDEFVKLTSGHQANLAAEAIQAVAGGLTACTPDSVTATLAFNGVSYGVLPRVLAVDNVGSRADSNDTLVIVNSVGGNLGGFAQTLRPLFGIIYDDAEQGLSFTFAPSACQFRSTVNSNFPKTAPRFDSWLPAGRSAWFKFWVSGTTAAVQEPILGAVLNRNPNAASNSGAFNGGHNLHKLNTTPNGTLTIPVFPVSCQ